MIAEVKEGKDPYLASFSKIEKGLPGNALAWLRNIRRQAMARFGELGFPKPTQEEWRFTNVAPIVEMNFSPASRPARNPVGDLDRLALCPPVGFRLVFVNGFYAPELSSAAPSGEALVGSLAAWLEKAPGKIEPHLASKAGQGHGFTALNTAFFQDGAFVYLPKGTVLEKPVHLLFITTAREAATVSHPRVLLIAEQGAKASVVEEYLGGSGTYFTNAATEIVLGENASLEHYKIGREGEKAFHVATVEVRQGRSSAYASHSVSLGGLLVRNDLNVLLDAEGAECSLNGLYMTDGRQHVDNHTVIDHAKPHGSSRELYKGVLGGQSRAVFNGAIVVRPNAQKTNARQANRNLVLSEGGLVNTKPEFKIFANDVQCKHGATIGQISPDALFYLRSRGIGPEAARQLLIYAFASEMVELMGLKPLREAFAGLLSQRLREAFKEIPETAALGEG